MPSPEELAIEINTLREEVARLRRANELYQLVLDTMPMAVFWKDAERLTYLGANRKFALDAGRKDPTEMIGEDDYQQGWAPQAELYRGDDRVVLESNQPRINYEEPQSREDGAEAWLRTSKIPLCDADGSLIGILGMYEDITERKHEELARESVILVQQDALRELSTPLIPIAEGVVAMPLVGAIDTHRAQQIMESLLEGVAYHDANVALLDISGVRVVDTQVADALLRTARAARLLGTQVVLTGISAEIAQTIVTLGADMSGIITKGTLREGLHYAIRAD